MTIEAYDQELSRLKALPVDELRKLLTKTRRAETVTAKKLQSGTATMQQARAAGRYLGLVSAAMLSKV